VRRDVVVIPEEGSEAVNAGLLAEGARVAGLLGGRLFALLSDPSECDPGAWACAAKARLSGMPFRVILFAGSDRGHALASVTALNFDAEAVTDCFDIRFRENCLRYVRSVCGGQFEQEVTCASPPEFASVIPESLEARKDALAGSTPAEKIHLSIPHTASTKKTVRILPPDYKTVDIRYAERILDIGAGCDTPSLRDLAEKLASLLEASTGATRLVVDSGSIPKIRMIGETGKTVAPEFTLTLGVSGSPHHIAGLRQSKIILSVNSDGHAPVFGLSDAGFVSDLNALLPNLIARIKQYRDQELP